MTDHNSIKHNVLYICHNCYGNFLTLKNVNGLGLGFKYIKSQNTGELCLQVLVKKKEPIYNLNIKDIIPKVYKNIKTDVVEVGAFSGEALNTKIRPTECGYSVGPANTTSAGTIACIVKRGFNKNIDYFILSNNHILAQCNSQPIGSVILQPSAHDGGVNPEDIIANLSEFIRIDFGNLSGNFNPNTVDCAIAKIINNSIISNKISWIGYPTGVARAVLGSRVKKTGRSTGRTDGIIRSIGVTGVVSLCGRLALFQDQFLTDKMSKGGDSGSLVLNYDNKAVGLLFASSSNSTLCNNFDDVLNSLRVELV